MICLFKDLGPYIDLFDDFVGPCFTISKCTAAVLKINFQVLYNLQKSGAKTFLLTNSGWEYTNQVLVFGGKT